MTADGPEEAGEGLASPATSDADATAPVPIPVRAGRLALEGLLVGLAAVVASFPVLRYWQQPFGVPFDYENDATFYLMLVRSMKEHGWYLTNPDDASWRARFTTDLRGEIARTGADGAFLDSASVPSYFGGGSFRPPLPDLDPSFERGWTRRLTRCLAYVRGRTGRPVIANAGSWVTTRDATDYSRVDGVMIEGFAAPDIVPVDWRLQLNRVLSLGLDQGWRRRTVKSLVLGERPRVLDVATGTGDLAIEIARATRGSTIVGVDPSAGMLAIASKKLEQRGLVERVTLELGDAQALTQANCSMDAARASTPRALPPIWCQRGRNAASTRGGTGSISRRSAASERRRSMRSTSASHHSVPAPPGENSPATTRPVAPSRLRACSTTKTPRPKRAAQVAAANGACVRA